MWLMIGYFFVESRLAGVYRRPYRSVVPSRAFTTIGVGAFHPAATRRVMSARSSVVISFPPASRNTVTGGPFGCEELSTKYLLVGEGCTEGAPVSGVSTMKCLPSR